MVEGQHRWTGLLIMIFAILILLAAVLFTFAYSKVLETQEYKNGNVEMVNAKNALLWAFILAYISGAIGIVLAILYFGHVTWGINSEIPHLILFILLFLMIIGSGIAAGLALSYIHKSTAVDTAGAPSWIWAGIVALILGTIILIISGAWRAQERLSTPTSLEVPQSEVTITSPSSVTHVTTPSYALPVASVVAPVVSAPLAQAPEIPYPYSI